MRCLFLILIPQKRVRRTKAFRGAKPLRRRKRRFLHQSMWAAVKWMSGTCDYHNHGFESSSRRNQRFVLQCKACVRHSYGHGFESSTLAFQIWCLDIILLLNPSLFIIKNSHACKNKTAKMLPNCKTLISVGKIYPRLSLYWLFF